MRRLAAVCGGAWLPLVFVLGACGQVAEKPEDSLIVPERYHEAMNVTGHVTHVGKDNPDGGGKLACRSCHDLEKDGFGDPGPGSCQACHEDHGGYRHAPDGGLALPDGGASMDVTCYSCHPFDVEAGKSAPVSPWGCVECHREPQGQKIAVSVHQSGCFFCHQPHRTELTVPTDCTACHSVGLVHGAKGDTVAETCMTCHDHHSPAKTASRECVACHSDPSKHKKKSAIVTRTALFETPKGDGHVSCASCHLPHNFEDRDVKPCASCHDEQHVLAKGATPKAHLGCDECHAPHDAKADARTCQSSGCHPAVKSSHPVDKAKEGITDSCMGCHPMHEVVKAGPTAVAKACGECHDEAEFTGVVHGKKKDGTQLVCADCHKDHDFKLALKVSKALCVDCHEATLVSVSKVKKDGHARCEECHAGLPHKPLEDQRKACVSCHEKDVAPQVKGHETCLDCHDNHSGEDKKQCLDCHKVPELKGLHVEKDHQKCATCHAPHGKQPDARQQCLGACHKDMVNHEPKAARCSSCHLFTEAEDAPGVRKADGGVAGPPR